ncbi:MAG: nicotinate (nicotinamide) nucleotide adenylyltransferase [Alistipes sp.]
MKRVMLYFGSFNPVHNGHIALAEYVLDQALCDEVVLIVSPQSPYKQTTEMAAEMDRFEMAEMACAASRYPDRIKASVVEFLLSKPSYTIDTLRYLTTNHGSQMQFSILMGADQIAGLSGWKEYEKLLEYPIFVYPRRDEPVDALPAGATLLAEAPLQDVSSTEIRARIGRGEEVSQLLNADVVAHICRKDLWSLSDRIATLTAQITANPNDAPLYVERGKLHYSRNEWGAALNDFNRTLELDAFHAEAQQYVEMVQEILAFRYKDIYNP